MKQSLLPHSPKYKAYQSKIRNAQIDRAKKRILSSDKNRKGKGQMIRLVSSKKQRLQTMAK